MLAALVAGAGLLATPGRVGAQDHDAAPQEAHDAHGPAGEGTEAEHGEHGGHIGRMLDLLDSLGIAEAPAPPSTRRRRAAA